MEKEVLKVFTDNDFGLDRGVINEPKDRVIVKGIIIDKSGNVAIYNKRIQSEYTLPGGVVKENQTKEDIFLKEIKRIIGCDVEIIKYLGIIEEEMAQDEIKQKTFVYVGRVLEKGKIDYQNQEVDEFGKVMWVSAEEALKLISDYKKMVNEGEIENSYHSKFSVYKDEFIIRYYLINYVYCL